MDSRRLMALGMAMTQGLELPDDPKMKRLELPVPEHREKPEWMKKAKARHKRNKGVHRG
jgi:hypothetical protein